MTPDELVKATDGVELKISELNQKIIDKIVENLLLRFEKTGNVVFSPSDEYSIKTLRRAGVTQADILAEIQKATPGIQKEVKKAFKQAATNIGKVKVNKHIQETLNNPIPEGANETGTTSEKIIDGRINEKELSARQKKLLEDVYSRTKNEIDKVYDGVARSGSNAFQDACNEAARMVRGGMGPQKAVREAIKKIAKDGTYIQYPSGHKDTIEVAVLRAVRTGVNQANAKLVLDLAEATGQDLVLVSSHEDARPAHQEWQGKIYSLSGKSKKYPEFRSATGFGTVQGLCGANCRHTFTIYYPGFSKNPYKRNNRKSNKKKYDYTQEQRKRERDIRKQKRIIDALEKAKAETNDPELKRELQAEIDAQKAKLREKKRDYNDFCEKHGLKKQAIRTHTYKNRKLETDTSRLEQKTENTTTLDNSADEIDIGKGIKGLFRKKNVVESFREKLPSVKNSDARILLERADTRVTYKITDAKRSYYDNNAKEVHISAKASEGTVAHELFHEIDHTYGLTENVFLSESLASDYKNIVDIGKIYGKSIEEMLYSKYPEAFYISESGKLKMYENYRGISDILHGMSKGKIYLGFGHTRPGYWINRWR